MIQSLILGFAFQIMRFGRLSPLAHSLASSSVGKHLKKDDLHVLPLCCGSLCKYFAVALGGVSAFLLAGGTIPLKVWDHASGVIICV